MDAEAVVTDPSYQGVADARIPELGATLSPAMQRYLLAILSVAHHDATVTATGVARVLECSTPTSFEMLRRLERGGLIEPDRSRRGGWRLTPEGQREIAALRRRQSVLERFLRTTLALDAREAAEEAARLGPSVSSRLEARLRDAVWPTTRPCRERP